MALKKVGVWEISNHIRELKFHTEIRKISYDTSFDQEKISVWIMFQQEWFVKGLTKNIMFPSKYNNLMYSDIW